MTAPWEAVTVEVGMLTTMAACAIFVGADFGGGIWDLLAGGTQGGARPRTAIDTSVTPVWEGNQVWIVLGLVLLWTGFPAAFKAVMLALFVPLSLSLLGLLLRGVGFAFRHESERRRTQQLTGVVFGTSSILAPFFLGTSVGAVATGKVTADASGNIPGAWLAPTPLMTGVLFVASCAYIGSVFMVGDAHGRNDPGMVSYFSRRALLAGGVTGLVALVNLVLLRFNAGYVFDRLMGPALPLVVLSVVSGATALVLVVLRRTWLLRIMAGTAVTSVIAAWGVAQYPWLLPRTLSLRAGSAPVTSLRAEIIVLGMAAVLVLPSFAYLYWLQQHGRLRVTDPSPDLQRAASAENRAESDPLDRRHAGRTLTATVTVVAGLAVLRDVLDRVRNRSG